MIITNKLLSYAIEKEYPTAKCWENVWIGYKNITPEIGQTVDSEIIEWKVLGTEQPTDLHSLVDLYRAEFLEIELAKTIREQRDTILSSLDTRINRYERQQKEGHGTTDTQDWYAQALAAMQPLRDVPQQVGFPYDIIWPDTPEV